MPGDISTSGIPCSLSLVLLVLMCFDFSQFSPFCFLLLFQRPTWNST